MSSPAVDVTELLLGHVSGNRSATDQLMPLVYEELRAMAVAAMRGERPDHTLNPTALVHEAYLQLVENDRIDWRGRSHFRAMAAGALRRILIDSARAHRAAKRGGAGCRITLGDIDAVDRPDLDVIDLDDALQRLSQRFPRQSQVVELRFFGGLGVEETAQVLDIAERTVKRDWRFARAWLQREMAVEDDSA